ncbi:MAG: hypothetical protein IKU10_03995, partial [Clostridia bacterium]|nr:hypothetical protein [Clostridia bacterium]
TLFFSVVCIVLSLSACGTSVKKDSQDIDLYHTGLDMISIMEEMIQSEEYADIIGANDVEELLAAVDTNDYDSPIAVYSISMPEITDLLKIAADEDGEQWNRLSDNLKKQIEDRLSFSTIVNMINDQQGGAKIISFSSIYTAFDKNKNIKVDDTTVYLYVFAEGTPIAITFSESGGVNGQFVFLEDIDTLSKARTAFEKYQCTVTKVDVD